MRREEGKVKKDSVCITYENNYPNSVTTIAPQQRNLSRYHTMEIKNLEFNNL